MMIVRATNPAMFTIAKAMTQTIRIKRSFENNIAVIRILPVVVDDEGEGEGEGERTQM